MSENHFICSRCDKEGVHSELLQIMVKRGDTVVERNLCEACLTDVHENFIPWNAPEWRECH